MIPVLKNPKLSGFLGGFFRQRGMAYLVFDKAKWGFKKFQAKSRDQDAGIKVRCLNIIRFWNVTFIPNLVFFFTKLVFNIDNNQCLLNNCFWCSKIKDIYYDIQAKVTILRLTSVVNIGLLERNALHNYSLFSDTDEINY